MPRVDVRSHGICMWKIGKQQESEVDPCCVCFINIMASKQFMLLHFFIWMKQQGESYTFFTVLDTAVHLMKLDDISNDI